MKTNFNLSLLTASILLFATSCMAPKPLAGKFNSEQKRGRDTTEGIFIVKKDGEKISGKKITTSHKMELLQTAKPVEESVAINGETVKFADYELVQTSKAYRALYYPEQSEKNCNGIYISRLRFGKISLYHYEAQAPVKFNYQQKRFYHEYVFQKADGRFQVVTYASFAKAIGDDKVALSKFKELFAEGRIQKSEIEKTLNGLLAVTELYNGTNNNDYLQASR